MATRPNSHERPVLDLIQATESGEVTWMEVFRHFRDQEGMTVARIQNLLESLYSKGWLYRKWPNSYVLIPTSEAPAA